MKDCLARYREYLVYIEMKYGDAYVSAKNKLNDPNPYGKDHLLKPELVLTKDEHKAMLYVPEGCSYAICSRRTR